MKKIHITTIVLVVLVLITTGCSKAPPPLFTASLCDCNCKLDDPQSACHPWEVCDSSAVCIRANANSDKCIPADKRMDENEY